MLCVSHMAIVVSESWPHHVLEVAGRPKQAGKITLCVRSLGREDPGTEGVGF